MTQENTFVDLFAGIGGFHLACHLAGKDAPVRKKSRCVFACEINEKARVTYKNYFQHIEPSLFKDEKFAYDITKVDPHSVEDFELLCAGFPCQPFSQVGHKKGFADTRGTLFFNVEEILRAKRPMAFFLENVRGLIKHGGPSETLPKIGKTMETIRW